MTHPGKTEFKAPDMNLSEFCKGQFWPIYPPSFEEMYRRLGQENAGGGLTQFAVNLPQQTTEKDFYSLVGDTAVIAINGPLTKRASFSFFFFGGTSYAFINAAVRAALDDDAVSSIVLRMDSPGGVVNGLEDTVDLIFEARSQKPIVAYADGMMASAAYEIASAANEIVAGATAMVGSIGVLMVHDDWSKYNEKIGIEVTYLTAGKYKALGNPDEPLSDLARQTFQDELDYLYTLFVETVARNRDVDRAKVFSDMADGRIFIGQQAADVGLVDRIGNFTLAFEQAQSLADDGKIKYIYEGDKQMAKTENIEITLELLQTEMPQLLAQIRDDALQQGLTQGHEDGVLAERVRVVEILNAEADTDQTRRAIEDGTEANAAFKQFYEAEKSKRATGLAGMADEAQPPAGTEEPDSQPAVPKSQEEQRREWRPVIGPAV